MLLAKTAGGEPDACSSPLRGSAPPRCLPESAVAVGSAVSSDVSCAELENDPSRLGSLDLSNRWCWWNEAVDVYVGSAPEGAGSGTFEIARKRYRSDARNVVQPHSVPLQQLADGGLVALGFFIALVLAAGATCVTALRRLAGGERAAAVALVAAPAAYLLHALVDYSWDFLAVTAPVMVALGVLASAGWAPGIRRARPVLGIGAALFAVVAARVVRSAAARRGAESASRRRRSSRVTSRGREIASTRRER